VKEPPKPIASIGPTPNGQAPESNGAGGASLVAPGWWALFQDDALDDLLGTALGDNPGLAEAKARLEAAQAEVTRADASRFVHADSTDKATRTRNSDNGDRAIYNSRTYTLWTLNPLELSYHLDLWGRDQELIAAAAADAEAAQARLQQSRLVLTAAVIKTYFAWRTADRLVALQETVVASTADVAKAQTAAVKAGIEPASTLVSREADLFAAQARLMAMTQKRSALRYALAALLGKAPDFPLPAAAGEPAPKNPRIPSTVNLDMLAARPDIRIARWNAEAARHQEEAAKRAYYPNINLHALVGLNSIGLSDLLKLNSAGYMLGPALNLPLFEGGALDANLHARASAYSGAVYAYNKTVLDAASQVAADLSNLDNTGKSLEDQASAQSRMEHLAGIAATNYRSGVGSRMDASLAQIQRLNSEIGYLGGKLDWLNAITELETDLGGGAQYDEHESKD
jgi:NodT family efflux transporter outer membrane factor (OMF) lipoprotein